MKRLCAGCGLRPVRASTRRARLPLYCLWCWNAADQRPDSYDLPPVRLAQPDRGVARAEMEARARRIEAGRAVQTRAERLLSALDGLDRWVWAMVVAGVSERRIAARLGLTRQEVYGWYLQRLREAAGLPARPRRYRGRAA